MPCPDVKTSDEDRINACKCLNEILSPINLTNWSVVHDRPDAIIATFKPGDKKYKVIDHYYEHPSCTVDTGDYPDLITYMQRGLPEGWPIMDPNARYLHIDVTNAQRLIIRLAEMWNPTQTILSEEKLLRPATVIGTTMLVMLGVIPKTIVNEQTAVDKVYDLPYTEMKPTAELVFEFTENHATRGVVDLFQNFFYKEAEHIDTSRTFDEQTSKTYVAQLTIDKERTEKLIKIELFRNQKYSGIPAGEWIYNELFKVIHLKERLTLKSS